jgi:hypothetical protein
MPWNGSWTPNPHGRRYVKLAPADATCAPARPDFTIDRDVHALMRPGDIFHLTNTSSAGKGISLLRNGRLIVAWGAVSRVPLGEVVKAGRPRDLEEAAARIYKSRDQDFEFFASPFEVRVGNVSVMTLHRWRRAGRYVVQIARENARTISCTDECVWIYDLAVVRAGIAFGSSLMRMPATELEWYGEDSPLQLELDLLPGSLALVRRPPDARVPAWTDSARRFLSVTRTPDELSIVADADAVPQGAAEIADYRALRVRGPLPLDAVGVLASLTAPLKAFRVPIFTVSTHDTDWILVREETLPRALEALAAVGHRVHSL